MYVCTSGLDLRCSRGCEIKTMHTSFTNSHAMVIKTTHMSFTDSHAMVLHHTAAHGYAFIISTHS